MVTPSYTVHCTKNVLIARDVYDVRFKKPEGFTFLPGQFILFDIPHPDNAADIQARAYSLASTPEEDELIFAIKLTPGGRASRWIETKLHAGTSVLMKGPFGFFTIKEEDQQDLLFVGTSTGIGPFRSQIMAALKKHPQRRIDLVYGVRSEEDLFWEEELTALAQQYENFHLHISLTQPSDAWTGHRGRVQTVVPQLGLDLPSRSIFVCGSPDMTKELKQLCLEQWGVRREQLHVEGYI